MNSGWLLLFMRKPFTLKQSKNTKIPIIQGQEVHYKRLRRHSHACDNEEDGYNQDSDVMAAVGLMGLSSNDCMIFDEVIGDKVVDVNDEEGI